MNLPHVAPAPPETEHDWNALALGLNDLQAELDDLRERYAIQEAELEHHRQQFVIASSLWQSVQRSRFYRALAPLRWLKHVLWPRGFDQRALIPLQQLDQLGPERWRSTGIAPQFLTPCLLPAGWVRFRFKMYSNERVLLKIFADQGEGFQPVQYLERISLNGDLEHEFFHYFEQPVQAIRFDPRDREGEFRIDKFQVDPVPGPWLAGQALINKLRLLRSVEQTPQALRNGLKLLARGQFRTVFEKMLNGLPGPSIRPSDWADTNRDYHRWWQLRRLSDADRARMRAEAAEMTEPPFFSVLCPVHEVDEHWLRLAIDSVRRQLYPHWELCIVDDGSKAAHIRTVLEEYAGQDERIKVAFLPRQQGISAATNRALEMARGNYLALLDHDDELAEHALFRMAKEVRARPDADMFYSDEDKLEMDGRHVEPFFKPDWSPEYFLACMYTCHLGVYRTARIRELGGFRSEFDLAQDYDLVLRLASSGARIVHVPDVLYHWRKLPTSAASGHDAKPEAELAARRALKEHTERLGLPARVEPGPFSGLHRIRYELTARPKVSIVICSACKLTTIPGRKTYLLMPCLESIRHKSTYQDYEIIVMHQPGIPELLRRDLERLGARCFPYELPFNWSAANNLGAARATGEQLVFLNDDTEVASCDWLESMLEFAQQPEIGVVGPKLLFPDGRIQHIGINLLNGVPGHPYYQYPGNHPGYFGSGILHRNCSAVTGACLMTPRHLFESLGGFLTSLDLNYSDVDYCLRVLEQGQRVVFTPYARLHHHESLTKPGVFDSELQAFHELWRERMPRDRYYSPNLTQHGFDYRIDVEPEPAAR